MCRINIKRWKLCAMDNYCGTPCSGAIRLGDGYKVCPGSPTDIRETQYEARDPFSKISRQHGFEKKIATYNVLNTLKLKIRITKN